MARSGERSYLSRSGIILLTPKTKKERIQRKRKNTIWGTWIQRLNVPEYFAIPAISGGGSFWGELQDCSFEIEGHPACRCASKKTKKFWDGLFSTWNPYVLLVYWNQTTGYFQPVLQVRGKGWCSYPNPLNKKNAQIKNRASASSSSKSSSSCFFQSVWSLQLLGLLGLLSRSIHQEILRRKSPLVFV